MLGWVSHTSRWPQAGARQCLLQTWKISFYFRDPFRNCLCQKSSLAKPKYNIYDYNNPLNSITNSHIPIFILKGLFIWKYENILSLFGQVFCKPEIFPRPWVAQVAPFSMSGLLLLVSQIAGLGSLCGWGGVGLTIMSTLNRVRVSWCWVGFVCYGD